MGSVAQQSRGTAAIYMKCIFQFISYNLLIINGSGRSGRIDLSGSRGERGRGPSGGPITGFGSGPHHLLCVALGFDQEDVALGQEDAGQQAEAGGQDGKNLDGNHELPTGAEVSGDERDPHDEEDQHAEGHTLRLAGRQMVRHGRDVS